MKGGFRRSWEEGKSCEPQGTTEAFLKPRENQTTLKRVRR